MPIRSPNNTNSTAAAANSTNSSNSSSGGGGNSSSGGNSSAAVCGGLGDIYRSFRFGTTMSLVRRHNLSNLDHDNLLFIE
jgi:hypothetical protein